MRLKCACGKESNEVTCHQSRVGDVRKESGFKVVVGLECQIRYICPTCYERCREIAKEMSEICNLKYLGIDTFLRE